MRHPRIITAYPFLVAVYAVLVLAAKNSAEVWPQDMVAPLAISLTVAAAALLLGRVMTRDLHLSGLIALALVVWFAWYGYMDRLLAHQQWLQPLSAPRYAAPLILFLLSAIPYLIARRCAWTLPWLTRYLNVTAVILVILPAVSLARSWVRTMPWMGRSGISGPASVASPHIAMDVKEKPDIYLIILDKYTGSRSLQANYGYDNHPFEASLRRQGFFVPAAPRSNYVHTHLALASILNWRLLDDRPPELTATTGALGLDYVAIEDNRSWRHLRDIGYRFVFFPSAYPATTQNRYADMQLPQPSEVVGEFGATWSRKTLLLPVGRWWCQSLGCKRNRFPYTPAPASIIDWKFEHLGQMPDTTGPLFVFAHFVLPHEPYVFEPDCTHREPYWPDADSGSEELPVKAAYVRQIQCVNRKVLKLTSDLLARSKTPPIIILQADHGHGRLGRAFATLRAAGPERSNERTDIFAAYYLPGHPTGVVYDSITPVNVLPRIFNHYFDAGIPLQPDATYWSTWDEPFQFTRIR